MEEKEGSQICFEQGKKARRNDLDLADNPFEPDTPEREQWYAGWCEANLIEHLARHPEFR